MKQLGYMAIDSRTGETLHLTEPKNPRAQLLAKLGAKHVSKMYIDTKEGQPSHIGYIVRGGWWTIYAVCEWKRCVNNTSGIDLTVHKRIDGHCGYAVTEGETGIAFSFGRTATIAIERAPDSIQRHCMEAVLKEISANLLQHGHSPRYQSLKEVA